MGNIKKIKSGEGEITFFFITLMLSFFIIMFLLIIVVSENNFAFERIMRTIGDRTTKKASIVECETEERAQIIFKEVKTDVINDSNFLFKHFLGKVMREKIINAIKMDKIVKIKDAVGNDALVLKSKITGTIEMEEKINGYYIYGIYVDYPELSKTEGVSKYFVNLVFIKYRPRSYGYIFIKAAEI